jgi:hypothetical protein
MSLSTAPKENPTLTQLRDWYRIARLMEAPESTLDAIKTVGQRVAAGKPLPHKHRELMQQQVQDYWQRVNTVIQQVEQILERIGQVDATGDWFQGQTYRLENSLSGVLNISTQQRGPILTVAAGDIQYCHLKKADFERFACFSQQVSQAAVKIPQLEMV